MSKTEDDPLGPAFTWRLRSALDRVAPPHTPPRYLSASIARPAPFRFAPAALAAAVAGVVALGAFATTGSANPIVWTQRAAASIESAGHAPAASPSPSPETESPGPVVAPPTQAPEHEASPQPEPSEAPERPSSPEPSSSPKPDGDGGSGSPEPSASPSPGSHDG
jgi:hypothetical protein